MFEKFTDDQNIYFDLDVLIKGDCNHLLRKEFTLCSPGGPAYHTPLNSSIMSWQGDCSWIHDKFMEQMDYYLLKYRRYGTNLYMKLLKIINSIQLKISFVLIKQY